MCRLIVHLERAFHGSLLELEQRFITVSPTFSVPMNFVCVVLSFFDVIMVAALRTTKKNFQLVRIALECLASL